MTTEQLFRFMYWASVSTWSFLAAYTLLTITGITPWWGLLVFYGVLSIVATIVIVIWVSSLD